MGCRALDKVSVASSDADALGRQQRNPTRHTHAAKLLPVDARRLHAPRPTHWRVFGMAMQRDWDSCPSWGRRVSQCSVAVHSTPKYVSLYSNSQCSVAAAMSPPHRGNSALACSVAALSAASGLELRNACESASSARTSLLECSESAAPTASSVSAFSSMTLFVLSQPRRLEPKWLRTIFSLSVKNRRKS